MKGFRSDSFTLSISLVLLLFIQQISSYPSVHHISGSMTYELQDSVMNLIHFKEMLTLMMIRQTIITLNNKLVSASINSPLGTERYSFGSRLDSSNGSILSSDKPWKWDKVSAMLNEYIVLAIWYSSGYCIWVCTQVITYTLNGGIPESLGWCSISRCCIELGDKQ